MFLSFHIAAWKCAGNLYPGTFAFLALVMGWILRVVGWSFLAVRPVYVLTTSHYPLKTWTNPSLQGAGLPRREDPVRRDGLHRQKGTKALLRPHHAARRNLPRVTSPKRSYTKRVKTVQTALSRISRAHRPRNERPRSSRARQVSAKSTAELTSRPGKAIPRSAASSPPQAVHDRARAGKQSLAAAQTHVPRPTHPSEQGHRPRPAKFHRPTFHPSDHAADRKLSATIVPTVRWPTRSDDGRSSRPTVRTPRSTRSPF
ncbi:unnamed protein product [Microthlaspi erraticum]|uniref:Uncharacterized protein n=1 Tax=Microthlaspi erraticum TaxID=1685480 RepID=A0A6D2KB50_9BRAS|nr:unnamed protein product [Microthlaspi erraticum]